MKTGQTVTIDYTNYQGKRARRTITPRRIEFRESEWHPGEQWILVAFDHDRQAERDFALRDVHSWDPAPASAPDLAALAGREASR